MTPPPPFAISGMVFSPKHIAAPGRDIWSTVFKDGYARASGTSPATAVATAAAALLRAQRSLSPKDVIERLIYTSDLSGNLARASFGGVVNPLLALAGAINVIRTKTHRCVLTTQSATLQGNSSLDFLHSVEDDPCMIRARFIGSTGNMSCASTVQMKPRLCFTSVVDRRGFDGSPGYSRQVGGCSR
jgi:hypothetical protein